ncbi:MAG: hypothetical protein ABI836_13820 [Gemmatimonadota bacterium]
MLKRIGLAAALLAGALTTVPALAQDQVPASLDAFKPHEVVEAFTAEAKSIGLTVEQLAQLDSLHVAVRDERHHWSSGFGNKAHQGVRMTPMISREEAFGRAMAILTSAQREAVVRRFNAPDYVPMVPSLASAVPASLEDLEPHKIVQVFIVEAATLGLSEGQVKDLGELHVAVRDEQHRYTPMSPGTKAPQHQMMEPMISRRRAYNDALSILTPAQGEGAYRRFNTPGYKPPALPEGSDR